MASTRPICYRRGMAELNPERWVEEHGDVLYRYALARTGDASRAEDLVQDTLLAAWKTRERFQGSSSVSTWLTGILRHKILDHFRAKYREPVALEERDGPDFREDGHWDTRDGRAPASWRNEPPGEAFWPILDNCLAKLPARTADAFRLRELEDESTEDICKALGLSPTHFWVVLHRARTGLRRCLETHWFKR